MRLIDGQAAIDALKRDEAYDEDIPNRADGVRDAIITIMGLPSVQPELNTQLYTDGFNDGYAQCKKDNAQWVPKKGKWIDMGDFEQCSACKGTHLKEVNTVYGKVIWIKSAYCPNCGADMRGEKHEL